MSGGAENQERQSQEVIPDEQAGRRPDGHDLPSSPSEFQMDRRDERVEMQRQNTAEGLESQPLALSLRPEYQHHVHTSLDALREIRYQVVQPRHPLAGRSDQRPPYPTTRRSHQTPASIPTPPPEPNHFYHQASSAQPVPTPAPSVQASITNTRDPYDAHSLTYLRLATSLGLGTGNGFFLHHMPLYDPISVPHLTQESRFFVQYQTYGYLEVTPSLINRICPADLCHKRCPFDGLYHWDAIDGAWKFGCKLLRLCEVLHQWPWKPPPPLPLPLYAGQSGSGMTAGQLRRRMFRYVERKGPGEPLRLSSWYPVDDGRHVTHCPYLHGVQKNCRDLRRSRGAGYMKCVYVLEDGGCGYGHDFEMERLAAYERLKWHEVEAERRRVQPGVVWRNEAGGWMGLTMGSREWTRARLGSLVPQGEEGEEFLRGLEEH